VTTHRNAGLGFGDSPKSLFDVYGRPDPTTISRLEKAGGVVLHYVGHAEITRILLEVDPAWTWEPLEVVNGRPAIHVHKGHIPRRDREPLEVDMATMWGRLTLEGVTRIAVGSVEAHKPDLDKELVSDFLRNAAMRFGIALSLWMKDDPAQVVQHPASEARKPQEPRTGATGTDGPKMASDAAKRFLRTVAKAKGYDLPDLGSMTARDAYDLTEKLKALPDAGTDQEEPF
jgi:hypothetical protein